MRQANGRGDTMQGNQGKAIVRFPLDIPASLHERATAHKENTGESMRQVFVKGAEMYLDSYNRDKGESGSEQ